MKTVRGRLVLHYLVLIITGVALVWMGTLWATRSTFTSYVADQQTGRAAALVPVLERYWVLEGSWTGVSAILSPGAAIMGGRGPGWGGMGKGGQGVGMATMPAYRAVLVDSAGNTVFDGYPQGGPIPAGAWDNAMAVKVDGLTVGTLLVTGTSDGVLGILEEGFLSRVRLALASIALVTLAAGLLLSIRFARSVSRPIERLAGAAADLASRRFGRKVDLLGENVPVEVSGLVDSFNYMSDELAAVEAARQELLRDISHEIRTPLTILSGNLEAVSTGAISLDADTLGTMTAEIERLGELVKGIDRLDHVSAVGGAPQSVSPMEVVERSAVSIQGAAAAKGIRVDWEVDSGLGDVNIYPDRVQQVFSNLLSNALRYTTEGGYIVIGAHADRGELRGGAPVVFSVRDSGPGIPHDQLQKVFERFFRGDSSRARATGGSGLGLAIAKGLVEGWGGTIWAENSREGGAIFSFTAPSVPKSQSTSSQSPML